MTLPGTGDSLTMLGCLYTVNAASGWALGSPQEVGWFPTEFKVRSLFMFAGLLQNMDRCFPNLWVARVAGLFPNLPYISLVVCGKTFLRSTKVLEVPGDGLSCLQFSRDASSDGSRAQVKRWWALWVWGELVASPWSLPAFSGKS